MTYTLFMDESGSAGINYLDAEQPFHVVAGVLVRDEKCASLRDALRSHQGQASELKAGKLLKTPSGCARLAKILECVGEHAVPFWCAMERSFAVVLKIVDVFFDPETNPKAKWLPVLAKQPRDQLADELRAHLPVDVIAQFANAYKLPTVESFTETLQALVRAAEGFKGNGVATTLRGALANVVEIVKHENFEKGGLRHYEIGSLNTPTMMHVLRLVDRGFDGRKSPYNVIHDETATFERIFTKVVPMFTNRKQKRPDVVLPDGTKIRPILKNIGSFTIANSKAEPCIQAADLVAGTVARGFKAITDGTWNSDLTPVCFPLLYMMTLADDDGTQQVANITMSGPSTSRVGKKFVEIINSGEVLASANPSRTGR